jgi:multiple antibiotic resistance protein
MLADFITSAIVTLLVVADPVLLSALFLGITHGMTKAHRREVAIRGSIIAFCILLAAGLGGAKLLDLLGISLSAFRIAGGLLLLSAAAEMVFDRRSERLKTTVEQAITVDHVKNIAAFPLAIPLMAGPGAITAMILLAGRAEDSALDTWIFSGGNALVKHVFVGGAHVVKDHHHINEDQIARNFRAALWRLDT